MVFPRLYRVRQTKSPPVCQHPDEALVAELERTGVLSVVQPGSRVVVAVGSRGIANSVQVIRTLVTRLKERGASVRILPAMGSHGGGDGAGQVRVLAELGITADAVGAPIVATMDCVEIGRSPRGIPIFADRACLECDHIVLVNRVKDHTEFHGDIQSGLLKMLAIGLGRYRGAVEVHNHAVALGYEHAIREAARFCWARLPLLAGVALIDATEQLTCAVRVVLPSEIEAVEPRLLALARQNALTLPLDPLDVLIVDAMGKNISGTGMDTKVIGRIMNIYEQELSHPRITRIFVRDLTHETGGNAIGIGLADFTTQRLVDKIDIAVTNLNCITAVTPEKARIPIAFENDRLALSAVFQTIGPRDASSVRLIWIRNTLALDDLWVSPAALAAVAPGLVERTDGPVDMAFDGDGNLQSPW